MCSWQLVRRDQPEVARGTVSRTAGLERDEIIISKSVILVFIKLSAGIPSGTAYMSRVCSAGADIIAWARPFVRGTSEVTHLTIRQIAFKTGDVLGNIWALTHHLTRRTRLGKPRDVN